MVPRFPQMYSFDTSILKNLDKKYITPLELKLMVHHFPKIMAIAHRFPDTHQLPNNAHTQHAAPWKACANAPLSDPQRGPCKFGERFGFDTDRLEATCVSLEEAGLVQPSRGYMYQQMTFPTVNGNFSAHYQVRELLLLRVVVKDMHYMHYCCICRDS